MGRVYGGLSAEERAAQRRARFIDAGLEEFGTRGALQTGVKDLCRRAGLTDRYFYESFTDTADLFAAVFDHVTQQLFAGVAEAVAQAPPGAEQKIRAAVECFVHAVADDRRLARIVFAEAGRAGPEAEQRSRAALRQFAALMAQTATALLDEDVDEQRLRFSALAGVGAIERVLIEWQDGELDLTADQLVDALTATLNGGLALALEGRKAGGRRGRGRAR